MTTHASQRDHLARLKDSNIHYLFQFLEDSELYDFSFTCVRLHKPALSVLLLRRHIPDPLDMVEICLPDWENTLRVLRVALFLPTIRQLSLRFSPGILPGIVPWGTLPPPLTVDQLQETTYRLMEEMCHILRLFEKLKFVEEISLILPGSLEWNLRDMNLECGPGLAADIFSWSDVVSFFHHAVAKQCTLFKVENSIFKSEVSTRPAKANARRSPSFLFRKILKRSREMDMTALARWNGVKYRPEPHTGHAESSIRHFHLQTTLLLFPGAAGWTFSILRYSPIVSLHISGLSVSRWDWDLIASKLNDAVPSLREFHLDDQEIEPYCLVQMLKRFSGLASLHLGPQMYVYLKYPHLFPPFRRWYVPTFRNLVTLSAPSCYVSLFLMRRNPLPALSVLEIPPIDINQTAGHDHESLHITLPAIIRRLRELNHVLSPLSLPVTFRPRSRWRSDITNTLSKHIDMSLALDPEVANDLCEITHLDLGEEFDRFSIDSQLICRWLRLFPSVREVFWDGSSPELVATRSIRRLASEISRACPTVETIIAQGLRHSISAILGSMKTVEVSDVVVSQFVELPTEVLLLVFDLLDYELFSLAILCRRLHFLALPIFLERHSIPDPCDTTRLHLKWMPSSDPIVRALTVALFIPSIKHLTCVFSDYMYAHRRVESIKRLTRLVRRLETVQTLSLNFLPNYYLRQRFTQPVYSEERLWQSTYSALRDLLDAVGSKSCTSLKIVGCPVPADFAGTPPYPPPSIPFVTALSLDVCAGAAPYRAWIYAALNGNPVSALKLIMTWDGADLDFPLTLTSLSISGKVALQSSLFNYLTRHPLLNTLTIESNPRPREIPRLRDPPTPRLANLVVLTAPLSYISHFFQIRDPFPALERLTMLLDSHNNMRWPFVSLLERVRESYAQCPPTITAEIRRPLWVSRLSQSIEFMSSMGGKWIHAARNIAELKVECGSEWFSCAETNAGWVGTPTRQDRDVTMLNPGYAQLLLNWFALFKSLRGITITAGKNEDFDEAQMFAALAELGELIGAALASVETIRFNQRMLFERYALRPFL
ncbi:hypothetical protein DFH08DRAFT_1090466 [Mycena albidolilacea]|uniref:F-box domain-containing protein n=1 Tax=Mycena albidolilacea TaxID=1033008 RepID=A0AAD6YWP8_9AGAR|nr:hypothetical protein DFH08DRAFT_1090466 [Mycena albidolilacea]